MKRIIITGASRGIGESIAVQMSRALLSRPKSTSSTVDQHHHHLLLTATNETRLNQVREQCLKTNPKCKISIISGDITQMNTIDSIITFVREEWNNEIDVLIHNAGIIEPIRKIGDLCSSSSSSSGHQDDQNNDYFEQYERNMNVNFFSVVKLTSRALPFIRKSAGNVIFISSGAATRAIDGWSAYCTSKAALLRFADCLALEEKSNGVKVLSVRPGVVATDMQRMIREKGSRDQMNDYDYFVELNESGKLLDANLVAHRICPLALEIPDDMNGQLVNQDDERVIEIANQFYL